MNDHLDPTKLASFASYADRYEIFDLFQDLLQKLVISKPADPIQFMIDQIKKPKSTHPFRVVSCPLVTFTLKRQIRYNTLIFVQFN